jgi:hypothetical protein
MTCRWSAAVLRAWFWAHVVGALALAPRCPSLSLLLGATALIVLIGVRATTELELRLLRALAADATAERRASRRA